MGAESVAVGEGERVAAEHEKVGFLGERESGLGSDGGDWMHLRDWWRLKRKDWSLKGKELGFWVGGTEKKEEEEEEEVVEEEVALKAMVVAEVEESIRTSEEEF